MEIQSKVLEHRIVRINPYDCEEINKHFLKDGAWIIKDYIVGEDCFLILERKAWVTSDKSKENGELG